MRRAARLLSRQQQTSHIRYAATQAVGLRIINSISDSSVEGTDVSHLPVNPSGSHAGIGITRQRSFASSQPGDSPLQIIIPQWATRQEPWLGAVILSLSAYELFIPLRKSVNNFK
jgi:hypothetical protein